MNNKVFKFVIHIFKTMLCEICEGMSRRWVCVKCHNMIKETSYNKGYNEGYKIGFEEGSLETKASIMNNIQSDINLTQEEKERLKKIIFR